MSEKDRREWRDYIMNSPPVPQVRYRTVYSVRIGRWRIDDVVWTLVSTLIIGVPGVAILTVMILGLLFTVYNVFYCYGMGVWLFQWWQEHVVENARIYC